MKFLCSVAIAAITLAIYATPSTAVSFTEYDYFPDFTPLLSDRYSYVQEFDPIENDFRAPPDEDGDEVYDHNVFVFLKHLEIDGCLENGTCWGEDGLERGITIIEASSSSYADVLHSPTEEVVYEWPIDGEHGVFRDWVDIPPEDPTWSPGFTEITLPTRTDIFGGFWDLEPFDKGSDLAVDILVGGDWIEVTDAMLFDPIAAHDPIKSFWGFKSSVSFQSVRISEGSRPVQAGVWEHYHLSKMYYKSVPEPSVMLLLGTGLGLLGAVRWRRKR